MSLIEENASRILNKHFTLELFEDSNLFIYALHIFMFLQIAPDKLISYLVELKVQEEEDVTVE